MDSFFCCCCFVYSRECVCGQNEDGLVISPACHQVVVFGKQYKWVKYNRTLPLWCRCETRTCTELNETVSVCHVWPKASTLVQAPQGWGQWHSLTSLQSLTPSCWTTFYWGNWLNECVCCCSYVCVFSCLPRGCCNLLLKSSTEETTFRLHESDTSVGWHVSVFKLTAQSW